MTIFLKMSIVAVILLMLSIRGWTTELMAPAPKNQAAPQGPIQPVEQPAELREGLATIISLTRGANTPFPQLRKVGQELLQKFPDEKNQAEIHYRLAIAYGHGGDAHAAEAIKHAQAALKHLETSAARIRMHLCWGGTLEATRPRSAQTRIAVAEVYVKGFVELLKHNIPEKAPDVPSGYGHTIVGVEANTDALKAIRKMHEEARKKTEEDRKRAQEIRELIDLRKSLIRSVRWLYRNVPPAQAQKELTAIFKKEFKDAKKANEALKMIVEGP